jgi:hypothetical protein
MPLDFKKVRRSLVDFTVDTVRDHDFKDPLEPVWFSHGGSSQDTLRLMYAEANPYERAKLLLLDIYRRIRFVDKPLYVFIAEQVLPALAKCVPQEFIAWTGYSEPLSCNLEEGENFKQYSKKLATTIVQPYSFIKEADEETYDILVHAIETHFVDSLVALKAEHGPLSEKQILEELENHWFSRPFNKDQLNYVLESAYVKHGKRWRSPERDRSPERKASD